MSEQKKVRKTISWDESADEAARRMAEMRGYFHRAECGGVSKFLQDMVLAEADRAREDPGKYGRTNCGSKK
jgi:hypothetical protein